MKDKIEIFKYDNIDDNFISIIELHKSLISFTKLNNRLIYFDENFPVYFRKVIQESKSDYIMISLVNENFAGFIHLKSYEDTVFLNNICLIDSYKGKGIGKKLLYKSLSILEPSNFRFLTLDVFKSNELALSWYNKIGLKKVKETKWKKILLKNSKQIIKDLNKISYKFDTNGFYSLYFENAKIGTIIKKETLLLHDFSHIEKIKNINLTVITNQYIPLSSGVYYETIDLESSIRMKGLLKNIVASLINQ
jgi:ribosomal protein S18 acetylase RimI-like enzyme